MDEQDKSRGQFVLAPDNPSPSHEVRQRMSIERCANEGESESEQDSDATPCAHGAHHGWHAEPEHEAAFLIQDAMDNVNRIHPKHTPRRRRAFLLSLYLEFYVLRPVVALFPLLTFVETPLWCLRHPTKCDDEHKALYPTWDMGWLAFRSGSLACELVCLGIVGAAIANRIFFQGFRRYLRSLRQKALLLLLVLTCLDLVYAYATPREWFRLAPFLRIAIFVTYDHEVRQAFQLVALILPKFFYIAAMTAVFVVYCGWVGTALFRNSTGEGKTFFPNMREALWSLLVLLTTANFPDVMMPAYRENRVACLFFVAFIAIGIFFLSNLMLALVYSKYQDQSKSLHDQSKLFRKRKLTTAFRIMDRENRGYLEKEDIVRVFRELNHYRSIAYITEQRSSLLFAALDAAGNNRIDLSEFSRMCDVLQVQCEKIAQDTFWERHFPSLVRATWYKTLQRAVFHRYFEMCVDALLLLSAVTVAVSDQADLAGKEEREDGKLDTVWDWLDLVFTFAFVVEIVVKVLALGPNKYWESRRNQFDCVLTLASAAVAAYVYYPNAFSDARAIHYALLVRLLRVLRVTAAVPEIRFISACFVRSLPHARQLLKVLFVCMFVFAALGGQLFGGLITTDPNAPHFQRLADSDFGKAGYYENNFNDMASGVITLFELLLVNNWQVITSGYVAVCGSNARLFFITWYGLGVVLIMNIVVAFILDTFSDEYEKERRVKQGEGAQADNLRWVNAREAEVNVESVSGTSTGLSGRYRLRLTAGRQQSVLNLFQHK